MEVFLGENFVDMQDKASASRRSEKRVEAAKRAVGGSPVPVELAFTYIKIY